MRIPRDWRPALDDGRLLVLSPFPSTARRPTVELAGQRNDFVADIAQQVFIAHAAPGSKTEVFARKLAATGKPLLTLDSPANENIVEMGAEVVRTTATLWRYMSFAKFCSLLNRKAVFFSLVGDMEDRYEGFIYPPIPREQEDRKQQAERLGHEVLRKIARTALISCWTESDHESSLMWESYAGAEGVAVRSTFQNLQESIRSVAELPVTFWQVEYVDYRRKEVPRFGWAPLVELGYQLLLALALLSMPGPEQLRRTLDQLFLPGMDQRRMNLKPAGKLPDGLISSKSCQGYLGLERPTALPA